MHWHRSVILRGLLAALVSGTMAQAQPAPGAPQSVRDNDNVFLRFFREGKWYFSWGYSRQSFARTDINVSQPSQGNVFTIHDVRGHDEHGDELAIFGGNLFVPQYNIRLGRFLNEARTIGVEFSIDHSKYTTTLGQTALVTGSVAGVPTNATYVLDGNFFKEQLHNGANHVMINVVYRYPLIGLTDETFSLAAIGKAGVGFMLPHTSDTILGVDNNVGSKSFSNAVGFRSGWWQVNGWTTGVEFGFRYVLYKPFYIELTDKVAYAGLSHLPAVYGGTLNHSLLMNEAVLSLGITFGGPSPSL